MIFYIGFHISLGKHENDEQRPKLLIEQSKVSFEITNIRLFPSIRKLPQNIEGQYTNNNGMRYYPTLWILADIKFGYIEIDGIKTDFKFNTRYPPHISLACVAVQLNVERVGKLENDIMNNNNNNNNQRKEDKPKDGNTCHDESGEEYKDEN